MMPAKVRYENNEVEIETIESNADRIVGLLKDIDIDSVDLQHAARDIWVERLYLSLDFFMVKINKAPSHSCPWARPAICSIMQLSHGKAFMH